jgi:hypothetical protein
VILRKATSSAPSSKYLVGQIAQSIGFRVKI